MKILIIGPLGAGKSSLAYALNKKYGLARLNLDEVCRTKEGQVRTLKQQLSLINSFLRHHVDWVMEGSQKILYERVKPDLIVDMRISRIKAAFRFTLRFLKAKKLIGRDIPADAPVQVYHYRKITVQKIREWDGANKEINAQIREFLNTVKIPVITCRSFKQHHKVFSVVEKERAHQLL